MARMPAGPARPPLRWILGVALLTVLVAGGGLVPSASAATITVTTFEDQFDDDAPCSLREAIWAANEDTATGGCPAGSGADRIVLGPGEYHLSFSPFEYASDPEVGDLDVWSEITVVGAGSTRTVIDGAWLNEFESDRIFHIAESGPLRAQGSTGAQQGPHLTLEGVTVRDGEPPFLPQDLPDSPVANPEDGGGIWVEDGLGLDMTDVVVDSNSAFEGFGGGVYMAEETIGTFTDVIFTRNFGHVGGAIYNEGTLSYTGGSIGTAVLQNDDWPDRNSSTIAGGGLYNEGTATLRGVDLIGNTALGNGGGGIYNLGTLTLEQGTVHQNFTLAFEGNGGGGIYNGGSDMTLTLTNVTLSGNASNGDGGGLTNDGAPATLTNVTVAFNRADDDNGGTGEGGGIYEAGADGSITLKNTILAHNRDGSAADGDVFNDCSGVVTSQGNNIVLDPAGCDGLVASDQKGVDPRLLPLGDYGGDTLTHALGPGSPAIDRASGAPATDQRGVPRPFDVPRTARRGPSSTTSDIGAFEEVTCFGLSVYEIGTAAGDVIDTRYESRGKYDVIHAFGGNDTIYAGPGPDRVCAGDGDDTILGAVGRDKIDAGDGNDRINGGGNPDLLLGGSGNDTIRGGGTLRDKGDRCKGGPGKDKARGCERGRA